MISQIFNSSSNFVLNYPKFYNPCTYNFDVNTKMVLQTPLIFLSVLFIVFVYQLHLTVINLWPVFLLEWYVNVSVPSFLPVLQKVNGKLDNYSPL